MRLKNKKTGEIGKLLVGAIFTVLVDDEVRAEYATLAELNEEWCDAPEEPKGCWIINVLGIVEYTHFRSKDETEMLTEIGNRFDTKEEAEKAVEKLKAWHELMDYWGTEILGWKIKDMPTGGNWQTVNVTFNVKTRKEPVELLDILFGDEE